MVSAWLAFLAGLVAAYLVPLACASLLARRPSSSSSHELYSSTADDALLLNLEPPATRWFNMGYWPRTQLSSSSSSSFAAAAADLCRLVARAAHLGPNQRICEVGYGSGDSTLLLEREFRPARYLGLTSLASQHATAGESPCVLRAQAAGLPTDRIQLRHGDAATDLASEPADSFDAVLAVDCAYHFNTRVAFLSHAQRILRPGGSLALTDLLLAAPPPPSSSSLLSSLITPLLLRTLLLVARAPWHNFVQPATYRAELVAAGFDPASIELRDVSDAVWPGFCHFVRERDARLGREGARVLMGARWGALRRYARVVEWYAGVGPRRGTPKLRFYVVAARKPAAPAGAVGGRDPGGRDKDE